MLKEDRNKDRKLERFEKLYNKCANEKRKLHNKLLCAKKQIKMLQKEVRENNLQKHITELLNEDQIKLLCKEYKKVPRWSNATLIRANRIKFACGPSGYAELLEQNFPLPTLRTLARKMENLKFSSGIIEEIFQFLQIKSEHFANDIDRDCVLVLDEMSITSGQFYDPGSNTCFGRVTLPDHSGIAMHSLVFMLAGISARWKQTVAYYFTGNSVNGEVFKPIVEEIIQKAAAIGLNVCAVTSDMGASNEAMWRSFGIRVSRHSEINNSCAHPCDNNRKLFFYADTPHLFKNIVSGLLKNSMITVPQHLVQKYNLPTNVVKSSHLKDVVEADKDSDLKLVPKLPQDYLQNTNHFQKMRVNNAMKVISPEVGSALEFLTEENPSDERLTTSWFIKVVSRWFKIMSSRNISVALSFLHEDKFEDATTFLTEVIDLFSKLQVGPKGHWKPFQTGLILSTTTVLELASYFLKERGYDFFLASRLTQDCLENLFSVMRMKNVIPNALQFKVNLKLITISQFMKPISNSNYHEDDREYLSEFLNIISKSTDRTAKEDNIVNRNDVTADLTNRSISFNRTEYNKIYNVAGYIMASILKNQKACHNCMQATGSKNTTFFYYSRLTRIRAQGANTLFFVNAATFHFFLQMEKIFRIYFKSISEQENMNLKRFFFSKCSDITFSLPGCHKLKDKIILRYVAFRLKISSKTLPVNKSVRYASKSMAMHNIIK